MAIITFSNPAPKIPTKNNERAIVGILKNTSHTRINILSTRPPIKPHIPPILTPKSTIQPKMINAQPSESLAPYKSRENISLPK